MRNEGDVKLRRRSVGGGDCFVGKYATDPKPMHVERLDHGHCCSKSSLMIGMDIAPVNHINNLWLHFFDHFANCVDEITLRHGLELRCRESQFVCFLYAVGLRNPFNLSGLALSDLRRPLRLVRDGDYQPIQLVSVLCVPENSASAAESFIVRVCAEN